MKMSNNDITLPESDHLNSKNFEFWYRMIRIMLHAGGLMKFIESEYLADTKKNNYLFDNDFDKATKEQALADSIIGNNLSSEVFEMVNNLDTPFKVFKVLKWEYDKDKSKNSQQ